MTGVTAGLVHLFNHALMKGALFMAMGCILLRLGSVHIRDMEGIGRIMPFTMAAFVVGGLSLIGVPLTAGFISKWYLVQATLEKGLWLIAALILVGSLMTVAYIWRVVEVAYFRAPALRSRDVKEAPVSMLIPTWLLIAANIYFGVDVSLTAGIAKTAAESLLGLGG